MFYSERPSLKLMGGSCGGRLSKRALASVEDVLRGYASRMFTAAVGDRETRPESSREGRLMRCEVPSHCGHVAAWRIHAEKRDEAYLPEKPTHKVRCSRDHTPYGEGIPQPPAEDAQLLLRLEHVG